MPPRSAVRATIATVVRDRGEQKKRGENGPTGASSSTARTLRFGRQMRSCGRSAWVGARRAARVKSIAGITDAVDPPMGTGGFNREELDG